MYLSHIEHTKHADYSILCLRRLDMVRFLYFKNLWGIKSYFYLLRKLYLVYALHLRHQY